MNEPSWVANARTDIGTIRKINEDAFFNGTPKPIWCVADGMGGHAKGDLASRLISTTLAQLVTNSPELVTPEALIQCLKQVNSQLWNLAQAQNTIIGSTVAILMLEQQQLHCIWAGDSRIYRLRNQRLTRLTRDHSQVEEMVEAGLLSDEEAESHPKANVITRAVGATSSINLEHKTYDLLPEDQLLLCSDGLNKVLTDGELEHLLNCEQAQDISQNLTEVALMRQAKDNVTCLYVYNENAVHQDAFPLETTLPFK